MSEYRTGKKPKKVRYHFGLVLLAGMLIFGYSFWQYMKNTTLEDVLSQDRQIIVPAISGNKNNTDNAENTQENTADQKVSQNGEIINPVSESAAQDNSYFDNCVFIGDSITFGLSSYEVVPASSVYASMGMNITNAGTELVETPYGKMTVIEALEKRMPENIYIMLGSNGAAWMTVGEMYSQYTDFVAKVKAVCAEARIFLISVPPVSSKKEESKESPILNSDIDSFNERLLDYASGRNYYYIDINSYFKDDSGKLPSSYAENDGLHFKFSAYEKFVDYILTHTAK